MDLRHGDGVLLHGCLHPFGSWSLGDAAVLLRHLRRLPEEDLFSHHGERRDNQVEKAGSFQLERHLRSQCYKTHNPTGTHIQHIK